MEATGKNTLDYAHIGKMMLEKFNSTADAFFENAQVDKITSLPIPPKSKATEAYAQIMNMVATPGKSVKIENPVATKQEIRNHALNALLQSVNAIFIGIISILVNVKTLGIPLVLGGALVAAFAVARMQNKEISFDEAKQTLKDYFTEQYSKLCNMIVKEAGKDEDSSPASAAPAISMGVPVPHEPLTI